MSALGPCLACMHYAVYAAWLYGMDNPSCNHVLGPTSTILHATSSSGPVIAHWRTQPPISPRPPLPAAHTAVSQVLSCCRLSSDPELLANCVLRKSAALTVLPVLLLRTARGSRCARSRMARASSGCSCCAACVMAATSSITAARLEVAVVASACSADTSPCCAMSASSSRMSVLSAWHSSCTFCSSALTASSLWSTSASDSDVVGSAGRWSASAGSMACTGT
mmetsp:Transcript_3745/g.9366  ORF Transcript_3745/g.9366 Transcript_3745/m.9366 type:complete len:223 (+) Transcript_3745:1038-1706(+)